MTETCPSWTGVWFGGGVLRGLVLVAGRNTERVGIVFRSDVRPQGRPFAGWRIARAMLALPRREGVVRWGVGVVEALRLGHRAAVQRPPRSRGHRPPAWQGKQSVLALRQPVNARPGGRRGGNQINSKVLRGPVGLGNSSSTERWCE